MDTDKIIDEISSLPPAAQRQVKDFVAFLRTRYRKPGNERPDPNTDITKEAFIGIWKDREDMKDSVKWLRETRTNEWGEPSA
jgi:hypothetical protein